MTIYIVYLVISNKGVMMDDAQKITFLTKDLEEAYSGLAALPALMMELDSDSLVLLKQVLQGMYNAGMAEGEGEI